ncbi:MAG: signal peptidase I [Erysipelotrichaceae bacterium]|nr:signal peptidase I [Erysipelotrichaceae bacterium]MDY3935014.1 signal peptidase I [Bacilli bacterium]
MKRSQKIIIGLLSFMFLVLLINSFITKIFSRYSICAFIFIVLIISYLLLGMEKEKSRYNKDIILSILIYIAIYYITTYLFGLFIGFNKNVYSSNIILILKNIVPIIILIPLSELLRYIINSKIKDNYILLGLSIFVFTLIDTTMTIQASSFKNFYDTLKVIGLFILPSLSKNYLLTYLTIKVSYKPNLVYRYLMELPRYILPIVTSFGVYIESVIYISFPIIVFIIIYNDFKKREKKNIILSSKFKKNTKFIYYIVTIILITIVSLTSGYFKYQAIVIATGSMTPNINKGDMVVIEKVAPKDAKKLKEGEVLAFKREDKIVVHRIYKIYTSGNEIFFKTKGDHNNAPDGYLTEAKEILGTVKFNIRYIGYPTVALYEKINR